MPSQDHRPEAVVRHAGAGEVTRWDDAVRGKLSYRTLLDGALDPAVTMCTGVAVLEAGGWLGRHRHAHPETYSILTGVGLLTAGNRSHELTAGSAIYLPGDISHAIRTVGSSVLSFLYTFPAASLADVEYEWLPED